jgi:hypothetical protein
VNGYTIAARRQHVTVHTWLDTGLQVARARARVVAETFGHGIDEVGVYDGDELLYMIRRDGVEWHSVELWPPWS